MPQIIKRKNREAKVAEGVHPATIRNVTLRSDVETPFGVKDLVVVEYQVDEEFLVRSYTQSLHEMSAFAQVVVATLGQLPYTEDGFDVDELVDLPCKVHVEHRVGKNGGVWEYVTRVSSAHTRGTF